jgi:phosphoribosylglycinamide formyltransferase-1
VRLGVLVSGAGTNLQALLDADIAPATIAVVVSNNPNAAALDRARAAGIATVVVDHRGREREAFEDALLESLAQHRVEAVVLAGFMRVLSERFVGAFPQRIVNTHPSLLPAFPGLGAPAQAIAHGVKLAGATIHFVDGSVDGGPIIAQAAVPVLPGDDAASLHARIQREEHRLLPDVVRHMASGLLTCEGRLVVTSAE